MAAVICEQPPNFCPDRNTKQVILVISPNIMLFSYWCAESHTVLYCRVAITQIGRWQAGVHGWGKPTPIWTENITTRSGVKLFYYSGFISDLQSFFCHIVNTLTLNSFWVLQFPIGFTVQITWTVECYELTSNMEKLCSVDGQTDIEFKGLRYWPNKKNLNVWPLKNVPLFRFFRA